MSEPELETEEPTTVVICGGNYGTMKAVETTVRYDPDVPEEPEELPK